MENLNKITHMFFYSFKQHGQIMDININPIILPTVNGVSYTEMREFKHGWSDWDDAVLVDIGGYENITSSLKGANLY